MVWVSIFAKTGIVFAGAWYTGETAKQCQAKDLQAFTNNKIKVATYGSYVKPWALVPHQWASLSHRQKLLPLQ